MYSCHLFSHGGFSVFMVDSAVFSKIRGLTFIVHIEDVFMPELLRAIHTYFELKRILVLVLRRLDL